ncbi:MAG: hypothetical protein IPP38_11770 [Bacteroidetes bacterium]|nr:hypothetical protein [Bacteroidota bacterium]
MITDSFSSNEPAICIDRINPANVYMACNRSNGGKYVGAYYSHDFGATWDSSILNSVIVPYGDPCILTDDSGYVYFIHDSKGSGFTINLDRLICNKSTDHGIHYSTETYIDFDTTYAHDKSFACIDQNPGVHTKTISMLDSWRITSIIVFNSPFASQPTEDKHGHRNNFCSIRGL